MRSSPPQGPPSPPEPARYPHPPVSNGRESPRRQGLSPVHADVNGTLVSRAQLPERVLDDDGRIAPHAEFQMQDAPAVRAAAYELAIPPSGRGPPLVLNECPVDTQVRRCRATAMRAAGNKVVGRRHRRRRAGGHEQLSVLRNAKPLHLHHRPNRALVVPCLLATRPRALKQVVDRLGVEQAVPRKTRPLEAVAHVRRDDEGILVRQEPFKSP